MYVLLLFVPTTLPDVSLSDLNRFPDAYICDQQMERCNNYIKWLEMIGDYYPDDSPIVGWIAQTRYNRDCWYLLYEAQGTWLDETWRLMNLQRLRNLIGPYSYGKGISPIPLPADVPVPKPVVIPPPGPKAA